MDVGSKRWAFDRQLWRAGMHDTLGDGEGVSLASINLISHTCIDFVIAPRFRIVLDHSCAY